MIIFHRISCLTAFILLCHLLTVNFTILPLPSNGFWTLCFTKLSDFTPDTIKILLVCVLILLLLYSTFTLQLQGITFLIAAIIIELSLVIAQASLTLSDQVPFYICIIKLQIDPILKYNYFCSLVQLYTDLYVMPLIKDNVEVSSSYSKILKEYVEYSLPIIPNMDGAQIATYTKNLIENVYSVNIHNVVTKKIPSISFYLVFILNAIYYYRNLRNGVI